MIIPEEVALTNYAVGKRMQDGDKDMAPFSMGKYLLEVIAKDPSLKDRPDRKAVRACRKKFLDAKVGEVVEVEDDHWNRIKRVIETPSQALMPSWLMEQFDEFDDAWCDAKSTRLASVP